MSANEVFINEAKELLLEIEDAILKLEEDTTDIEAINSLFRAMHTIKGSGAMFGFDDIADFTHHVETLMDQVRSGKVLVTQELISLILQSHDHIAYLFECSMHQEQADFSLGETIISKLHSLSPGEVSFDLELPNIEKTSDSPLSAEDESTEKKYLIIFEPHPEVFLNGTNPLSILDELSDLGQCQISSNTTRVPSLEVLNPEHCYFSWEITLITDSSLNEIKDVFIFVEDDAKVEITLLDNQTPPNPPLNEIVDIENPTAINDSIPTENPSEKTPLATKNDIQTLNTTKAKKRL
jgi:two-component system, chemotaxis family, sensor kinase CheA